MSLSRRTFLVSAAATLGLTLVPKGVKALTASRLSPSSTLPFRCDGDEPIHLFATEGYAPGIFSPIVYTKRVVIDWRAKRVLIHHVGAPSQWVTCREGGPFTVHDLGSGISRFFSDTRQWGEQFEMRRMYAVLIKPMPDHVLLGRQEYDDVRHWSFSGKDVKEWPPSAMFGMRIIRVDSESHFELGLTQHAHDQWVSTLNEHELRELAAQSHES